MINPASCLTSDKASYDIREAAEIKTYVWLAKITDIAMKYGTDEFRVIALSHGRLATHLSVACDVEIQYK